MVNKINRIEKIKKQLKILLPLLLVLVIILIIIAAKNPINQPTISTEKKAPGPKIPQNYSMALPLKFDIDKKNLSLPKEASIISLTKSQISPDEAVKIASNLGFKELPKNINSSIYGQRYYWKSDDVYLYISLKVGNVNYGRPDVVFVNKVKLEDDVIINKARSFMKDNIIFYNDDAYKVSSITFLKKTKTNEAALISTTKEDADYYQVNFVPSIAELEVVAFFQSTSPYNVTLLVNGDIRSLNIDKFSNYNQSIKYPVKEINDIEKNLQDISLVSVEGFYTLEQLPLSSIKNIIINKIKIAYLLESGRIENLYPVFILEGKLTTADNKEYRATLYSNAIKNP